MTTPAHEELWRIAEAATRATRKPWFAEIAGEVCCVLEGGAVIVIATVNPMAELNDATEVAHTKHITTFDPPTVLRLLARIEELEGALTWIAAFADMRSKDDSKTFARVNRGALRTIAERASQTRSILHGDQS